MAFPDLYDGSQLPVDPNQSPLDGADSAEAEEKKGIADNAGRDKLVIYGCTGSDYELAKPEEKYEVLINPEEFQESVSIQWDNRNSSGSNTTEQRYDRTLPQSFTLKLLFDSTGAVRSGKSYVTTPVMDQIKAFKEIVLDYKTEAHKPRHVKMAYGQLIIKGVLYDLDITYTLFQKDGTPIRARANATFQASVSVRSSPSQVEAESPDLTHIREVKAGDSLHGLTKELYGDNSHYLEVARFNRLKHFRKLKPGTALNFPPLER